MSPEEVLYYAGDPEPDTGKHVDLATFRASIAQGTRGLPVLTSRGLLYSN